jgi:hypothetical protein
MIRRTAVAAVLAAIATACGGDDGTDPNDSGAVTLKDVTLTLPTGQNCDVGGVTTDFTGESGKTVVITATTAASLHPQFTLYAPDFDTQLGGSTSAGAGKATLTFVLTQSGDHHVSACDANGGAGTIRIVVKQQSVIGS